MPGPTLSAEFTGPSDWPHPDPPLVTICFTKHHGATYPQAVAVAHQATAYREHVEGRRITHVATFARTAPQAAAAQLLALTVQLKPTVVLDGDGVPVPSAWKAHQVLDCYRQASLCADPTAYCQVVIADPFRPRGAGDPPDDPGPARWLLPCHRINRAYLAFDPQHPARAVDLLQAAAVRHGSQWCPNFDAGAFRPLARHRPFDVVEGGGAASREDQASR